jgi:hypothetical protein
MSTMQYRLTLITCVTTWLLLGMHLPALHQFTHHGRSIQPAVLAIIALLAVIGLAGLWVLLRSPWSIRTSADVNEE